MYNQYSMSALIELLLERDVRITQLQLELDKTCLELIELRRTKFGKLQKERYKDLYLNINSNPDSAEV